MMLELLHKARQEFYWGRAEYLLIVYYEQALCGDSATYKTDTSPHLHGTYILVEETDKDVIQCQVVTNVLKR